MQAYIQAIFGFVVAVGVLVTLHELGHFWVARACGVRVLRFAIGFGPRLVGWTSQRSGTEYVIGLLIHIKPDEIDRVARAVEARWEWAD